MALKYLLFPLVFLSALTGFSQQKSAADRHEIDSLQQAKKTADSLAILQKADSLQRLNTDLKKQLAENDTLIDKTKTRFDSIPHQINGLTDRSGLENSKDSLTALVVPDELNAFRSKGDTIKTKMDRLKQKISVPSAGDSLSADRLKSKVGILQKGDSLGHSWKNQKDSLSAKYDPNKKLDHVQGKLDSLQRKVTDTLTTRVKRKFAGLSAKKDSLHSLTGKPGEAVTGVQGKIEGKVDKMSAFPGDKVDKLGDANPIEKVNQNISTPGLNGKLPDVAQSELPVNTPGLNLPGTGLPGVNTSLDDHLPGNIEGIDTGGVDELSDNVALPGMGLPDVKEGLGDIQPELNLNQEIENVTDLNINDDLQNPLGNLKEKVDDPVGDVKDNKVLDAAKEKTAGLKEVTTDLEGVNTDIQAAREGDSEALEKRVADQLEVAGDLEKIRQQQLEMTELQVSYEDKLKVMRELQDQEVFEKKLEEALKQEVPNYFLGKEEQLGEAQKLLTSYKKKYSEMSSIQDQPLDKAVVVRNERFMDRLMLGADMEFVRSDVNFFDVAPYLGYKLTRRWHLKAGYSWRFGISIDDGLQVNVHSTQGLRTAVNFDICKGLMAVAGYERTQVDLPGINPGEEPAKWANMAVLGIRKKYRIIRNLYGDGQVLYNFSLNGESTFDHRINLRFGFFIDFKSN